jgi:hypothetical protein
VLLDVDTPAVRDGLARMLADATEETAAQAALGLARRRDPRACDALHARLLREEVGSLWVEAADELGDPRLLPLLERLRPTPCPWVLEAAITSCSRSGRG